MSSGCGDILSLADLQTARKHQLFEAEVITGLQGGVAGGTSIDYATNPVTGQTQKTLPAVLRDAGFRAAGFTFSTGGTLGVNDADLAVMWPGPSGNGLYYSWHGALPKTIPAGSSPASTGGESNTAWKLVGDLGLRQDLAAVGGVNLVNGAARISGQSFTGDIDAPHVKTTNTFGGLFVGPDPVGTSGATWPLPDSLRDAINVSRTLSNTPFNCHAFSDKTVLNQGTVIDGYGAFDSTVIIYGSHHQDHAHSFQDRISYRGTNRIDNSYGYYSAPTISGSGTMGDRRGVYINDVAIYGGGHLVQQTGVYLEDLKAASGINVAYQTRQTTGYTFYAPNAAKMYHNGPVGFGYDPVAGSTNFALHFRGAFPATSFYGFLHTDVNGASFGVSQDTTIQFIQGGAVRAKIKPQATTLSAFTPGDDGLTPLGDATNRWKALSAASATIITSDESCKTELKPVSNTVLDAVDEISISEFMYKTEIDAEGDSAKIHYGIGAQTAIAIFEKYGLNPHSYAIFEMETLEDGSTRYGVRYDHLFALKIACLERKIKSL